METNTPRWPLKLAGYLREAANIRTGYRWTSSTCCNCGLLYRTAMKIDRPEALWRLALYSWPGPWAQRASDRCAATGLPNDLVARELVEHSGMRPDDIEDLEYFGNDEIRTRAGVGRYEYSSAIAFEKYCLAWASLIEEEHEQYAMASADGLVQTATKIGELVEV